MKIGIVVFVLCISSLVFSQKKATYTYAIKGKDTLKIDVYTPRNIKAKDSLPTLIWMHGGGFSGGKRDNVDEVKMLEDMSKRGYLAISISYRLLRKNTKTGFGCDCPKSDKLETFKQAVIDYLDAAKFIFENKSMLQIDTDRVIAGGSSAGAEGVLMAAYMKHYFVDELEKYRKVKFTGVISLAGALLNAEYITMANALPTVMVHGTADDLIPFGSASHRNCNPGKTGYLLLDGSETIAKKLDDLGVSYYLNKVIGGKHEHANIPFGKIASILEFFDKTILTSEVIQTKKITKIPSILYE